jgi:hypothetical protein
LAVDGGGVEVIEGFFHLQQRDLGADAAEGFVFLDVDGAVSFADAGEDCIALRRNSFEKLPSGRPGEKGMKDVAWIPRGSMSTPTTSNPRLARDAAMQAPSLPRPNTDGWLRLGTFMRRRESGCVESAFKDETHVFLFGSRRFYSVP